MEHQKLYFFIATIAVVALLAVGMFFSVQGPRTALITNFQECAQEGYPVMESYPRQCRTPNGETFVENVGNELSKQDLIRITQPRPNETIKSPLVIRGEARGYWFFEASFPIRLLDSDGKEIAVVVAQAKDEWMTEEFVPFEATLIFDSPLQNRGALKFEKDNPSGLPEHDDALIIPVAFETTEEHDKEGDIIFCTQDAKLCPDGSYVGRTGPKCEFAPCPPLQEKELMQGEGRLMGKVSIGPLCPVEPCQGETMDPYSSRFISLELLNDKGVIAHAPNMYPISADGSFNSVVPAGTYRLTITECTFMGCPYALPKTITIKSRETTTTHIDIDTGIR